MEIDAPINLDFGKHTVRVHRAPGTLTFVVADVGTALDHSHINVAMAALPARYKTTIATTTADGRTQQMQAIT